MHPILYQWGSLRIGSYGVLLALAFAAGILVINREFRRHETSTILAWDIYLLSIIGGLVGSRLLYIFENWHQFLQEPGKFAFTATGFSVIGGYLLAIVLCAIRIRYEGERFLKIADLCAPGLAIGYTVGRLGCIGAGDGCYGVPTLAWYGMTFPNGLVSTLSNRNLHLRGLFQSLYPGQPVPVDIPVHPTPLYESISHLVLLVVLLRFPWQIGAGRRFAMFLAWFGVSRFLVEFIRLNPILWGGLTSDQFLSIGEVLLCLLILWLGRAAPQPPASPTSPGTAPEVRA